MKTQKRQHVFDQSKVKKKEKVFNFKISLNTMPNFNILISIFVSQILVDSFVDAHLLPTFEEELPSWRDEQVPQLGLPYSYCKAEFPSASTFELPVKSFIIRRVIVDKNS